MHREIMLMIFYFRMSATSFCTSSSLESSSTDVLEISSRRTEQQLKRFNAVTGLDRRRYVMRSRIPKAPCANVRGKNNLTREAIRNVHQCHCCEKGHLHSMSGKYIRARRTFFWTKMNRTQRHDWVTSVLCSLSASWVCHVSSSMYIPYAMAQ